MGGGEGCGRKHTNWLPLDLTIEAATVVREVGSAKLEATRVRPIDVPLDPRQGVGDVERNAMGGGAAICGWPAFFGRYAPSSASCSARRST